MKEATTIAINRFVYIENGKKRLSVNTIKALSSKYSNVLEEKLSSECIDFQVLSIPKTTENSIDNMNLNFISNEAAMSEWLGDKMNILSDIITNKSHLIYTKENDLLYIMNL